MRGRPSGSTRLAGGPVHRWSRCFLLEGLQVRADAFVEREWRARDLRDIQLGVWRFGSSRCWPGAGASPIRRRRR